MTEHRRSTDHPDSIRDRRTVILVATLAAVAVAIAFAAAGVALYLNAGRTQQIQDERAASVVRNCTDTNAHHDKAIVALNTLLARASVGAGPVRLAQLEQSRASTMLLISALAPKQDCKRLVSSRVRTG